MPPRPFPFRLHVGTDICEIARVQALLSKPSLTTSSFHHHHHDGGDGAGEPAEAPTHLNTLHRFLRRLLTAREQHLFWAALPSGPGLEGARARYLAARWAAKEAVIKAVRPRRLRLHEILILKEHGGPRPYALVLDPGVRDDGVGEPLWVRVGGCGAGEDGGVEWRLTPPEGDPGDVSGLEGQVVPVSISHETAYATACCIAPVMEGGGGEVD